MKNEKNNDNISVENIIDQLKSLGNKEKVKLKEKKFAVVAKDALGVYQKDLEKIAKKLPKDFDLAISLFETGIYEAKLLCSKIFPPKLLTEELMESWLVTFDNWEICDSFSMKVFARSSFVVPKAKEWSLREREFEKRAAFAMIAAYCMADKKADNEIFHGLLNIIKSAADDERNFVKKAVNWALRNIGKRNIDLRAKAIQLSRDLLESKSKSANWIARNALRELEKDNLNILDYPREIYRKG